MRLSKNISRHEVACKCGCGADMIDYETIVVVQGVCDYFSFQLSHKVILDIHSGCRCITHNRVVGGARNSKHLTGRALDFSIREVGVKEVQEYLMNSFPDKYGIGCYNTFTHLDTRTNAPARWVG